MIESYYTSAKAVPLDADSKTVTTKLVASAAQQPALVFTRKISQNNLNVVEMDQMPGFRLTWHFDQHITREDNFFNELTYNQRYQRYAHY